MRPGFLLKMADDTGDGFTFVIFLIKDYKDILISRNPTSLVRCVVRERDYQSDDIPVYRLTPENMGTSNHKGSRLKNFKGLPS